MLLPYIYEIFAKNTVRCTGHGFGRQNRIAAVLKFRVDNVIGCDVLKTKLPKRTFVRIISFFTALCLAFAVSSILNHKKMQRLELSLSNNMSESFNELKESINSLNISLEKGMYCSSVAGLGSMSAEMWRESGSAKTALAALPYSENGLTVINKFLSQVGDYSLYLTRKTALGDTVSEEERESLKKLSEIGTKIYEALQNIGYNYSGGSSWNGEIEAMLNSVVLKDGFGNSLSELEETLTDYPTLIYDGPFSDSSDKNSSKSLENLPEVNADSAKRTASYYLNISEGDLKSEGESAGKLPTYDFSANNVYISLSKRGGEVVSFRKYSPPTENKIKETAAVEKAKEFLKAHGYPNMQETYYFSDEGVCTVNFAFSMENCICYSDLIKVGVSLKNGEIVLFDAEGYIMNHISRQIPVPLYSEDEARAKLSPMLSVKKSGLAIIPSNSNEKAVYEFLCDSSDGREVLVYINCQSLAEEKILVLLKTDGGTLTK